MSSTVRPAQAQEKPPPPIVDKRGYQPTIPVAGPPPPKPSPPPAKKAVSARRLASDGDPAEDPVDFGRLDRKQTLNCRTA